MDKRGNATVPLLSLPHPDKTKLVFKDVLCSGFLVEAIIDTGAGITVISPKFSKMLTNPIRGWVGPGILLADGHKALPVGQIDLVLTIDSFIVNSIAIVMEINGFDLLLGNDTLRLLKSIQIKYDDDRATFCISVPSDDAIPSSANYVFSKTAQTIPACSMVYVEIERRNFVSFEPSVSGFEMIEPSNKVMEDKGVSVGRICFPSNFLIDVVQLVNFSQQDQ